MPEMKNKKDNFFFVISKFSKEMNSNNRQEKKLNTSQQAKNVNIVAR